MAAGASVTWTHCSVLFEVTWSKNKARPRGRISLPSPLRPSPPLPSPLSLPPLCCPRRPKAASARTRKKINYFFIFLFFLFFLKKFGSCCRLGKREKIYNLQFSVFNPQNPRTPRAPRASWAKLREEEGFSGLVPLVIHPSSIPLLGGLTPKFLSLSLHSL
jgi:hypothetical protein